MPNYEISFFVGRTERYRVEAETPQEARDVAHQRVKQAGPLEQIVHRSTVDLTAYNELNFYDYNYYYDQCEKANVNPKTFDKWLADKEKSK